jgi:hypothetical protein
MAPGGLRAAVDGRRCRARRAPNRLLLRQRAPPCSARRATGDGVTWLGLARRRRSGGRRPRAWRRHHLHRLARRRSTLTVAVYFPREHHDCRAKPEPRCAPYARAACAQLLHHRGAGRARFGGWPLPAGRCPSERRRRHLQPHQRQPLSMPLQLARGDGPILLTPGTPRADRHAQSMSVRAPTHASTLIAGRDVAARRTAVVRRASSSIPPRGLFEAATMETGRHTRPAEAEWLAGRWWIGSCEEYV